MQKKILETIDEPEYIHLPKREEKIRIAALDYKKVNPFLPIPSAYMSTTSNDLDEADIEHLDMPNVAEQCFNELSLNLDITLPDLE